MKSSNKEQHEVLSQMLDTIMSIILDSAESKKECNIMDALDFVNTAMTKLEKDLCLSTEDRKKISCIQEDVARLVSELKTREINRVVDTDNSDKYQVILHDDKKTPVSFAFYLLDKVFDQSFIQAQEIVLEVNHSKQAIVSEYFSEQSAQNKVQQACELILANGYEVKVGIIKIVSNKERIASDSRCSV